MVSVTDNIRRRQTLFCVYAHYSAMMSASFYALTGLILLCWGAYGKSPVPGLSTPRFFEGLDAGVGSAALLSGFCILLYEIRFGEPRAGVNKVPFRGIIYAICAAPGFLALPTGVGAVTMLIPAVVNCYSTYLGESYRPPLPPRRPPAVAKPAPKKETPADGTTSAAAGSLKDSEEDEEENIGCCAKFLALVGGQNPDRQIGRIVFLLVYIAGNVVAGALHALEALEKIDEAKAFNAYNALNPTVPPTPDLPYHTRWIGMSKFFGNIMNFNYTFILIPVSHSLMRWIVDNSRGRTCFGTLLRAFLWILPVDDAIKIHKLVAYTAFVAAMGHTIGHLFNYVSRPDFVWDTFGAGIWVTGIMLIFILFTLYPATNVNVKRGHFEIFWITHMLYVALFILTFIHGKGMLGPNYWKWLILPGTVYVCERIYRELATRKPVSVVSVTFMSNQVMSIAIAKSGALANYMEGQYAYISCPALSSFQWHPFTISSAPQEDLVTFHIRIQDRGSWTYRLRDFFRIIGSGSTKACLKLAHLEDGEIVPGLIEGPSGQPLLRIHGPYSAPTQHFCEYNEVLVTASGIGVTPLSSALKSIVHFRWQYAVDRAFPDNATFVWVAAHKEIPSFRWLVRTIKEAEDALSNLRARNAKSADVNSRKLKILIYITSYSQAEADKFLRLTEEEKGEEQTGLWGQSYFMEGENAVQRKAGPFTEAQLYNALMNPAKGSVTMGDVTVTLGRPKWDEIFNEIHTRTTETNVGVTFCGNPMIGKDLKTSCLKFTHKDGGRITWHLHKEVF